MIRRLADELLILYMNTSPVVKPVDYWGVVRNRLGLVALIFLLVVITVGVTTFLMPQEYMPFATIDLLLGVVAGLVLGIAFAFFLEYPDTRVKTTDEVDRLLDLPVLAVIPKGIQILPQTAEGTADAYRLMKTNVDSARRKVGASLISVASGGPSEGKSTTVCNLATAYANSGLQTLIVDSNLRRPAQHELFDLDNRVGLGEYLQGEVALDEVIRVSHIQNLYVITSGAGANNAVSLLNSDRMRELVETAKDWFDVVIFDCPPILEESDALVVSALVEGSIIVAQHRKSPHSTLVRAKAELQDIGTKCLGVVLNNVDIKHYHDYRYYPKPEQKKESAKLVTLGREEERKASTVPQPSANGTKPKKAPPARVPVDEFSTEALIEDVY